jgi:hypothetical protein
MHLWAHCAVVSNVAQYTPAIKVAASSDSTTTAAFFIANPDLQNQGFFEVDGSHLPPTYDHHIDDLMSAESGELLQRTFPTSILSLNEVLGKPAKFTQTPSRMTSLMPYTLTIASLWVGSLIPERWLLSCQTIIGSKL